MRSSETSAPARRPGKRSFIGRRTRRHCRDFYNSSVWRRTRAAFRFAHPYCELCAAAGKRRSMAEVDHIIPIQVGGALVDPENLMSLCRECHQQKTREDIRKHRPGGQRPKRDVNRRFRKPRGLVGFNMDGTAAVSKKGRVDA